MGQAAGKPECVTGSLPRKSITAFFKKRDKWYIDYHYQESRIRECVRANKRQDKNGFDARKGWVEKTRAVTERNGAYGH